MFLLAILLGIYGYGIFFLGVVGRLYGLEVIILTGVVGSIGVFYLLKRKHVILNLFQDPDNQITRFRIKSGMTRIIVVLLLVLVGVNLIGVLGPEISFDALWYHLTLPKLFLQEHIIRFIPGGLLYYSVMPKLGEMFFVIALLFGNELWAKVIQFIFGILSTVAIYQISRKYFSITLSLLSSLIFYSNIVVAWESTVAYVDLIRAFYEVMSLWAFLQWFDTKKLAWLCMAAVLLGFAISTKILALGSLFIFTILIVYAVMQGKNFTFKSLITNILVYWYISIFVVFPWVLFSYITTGNPVYPFFTSIYPISHGANIITLFPSVISLFLFANDPISPIYLIVLPLIVLYFSKLTIPLKLLGYYSLLALVIWYFTPNTGGGRFIVPYLPAWSILVVAIVDVARKQAIVYRTIVVTIFTIACITIFYRGLANIRYIPVILGKETKQEFLTKHLNFSYGDFYDIDDYFSEQIKTQDTVLLYGFHNLYYVDFPFVDSSWIRKGETFNYVATQYTNLPERFKNWQMIYENKKTGVKLYNNDEKVWTY